ncbi:hypothetical protein ACTMU2_11360 [Cupriavidus basilensis]
MSSINPVFLLPAALSARGAAIARGAGRRAGRSASGQFCTNPGLLLALEGPALDAFRATARGRGKRQACGHHADTGHPTRVRTRHRQSVGDRRPPRTATGPRPTVRTRPARRSSRPTAQRFIADPRMHAEVLGRPPCWWPAAMWKTCSIARELEGQLTATVQADQGDYHWPRNYCRPGAQGGPRAWSTATRPAWKYRMPWSTAARSPRRRTRARRRSRHHGDGPLPAAGVLPRRCPRNCCRPRCRTAIR